ELPGPGEITEIPEGQGQVASGNQGVWVLAAQHALFDLQSLLVELPGTGEITESPEDFGQVGPRCQGISVLAAQHALVDLQGELKEEPGAGVEPSNQRKTPGLVEQPGGLGGIQLVGASQF